MNDQPRLETFAREKGIVVSICARCEIVYYAETSEFPRVSHGSCEACTVQARREIAELSARLRVRRNAA